MDEEQISAIRSTNERPWLIGLAKYVLECWEDARQAKQAVLPRLQKARRARIGEYDPAKLAQIAAFGGSEVYPRITANKCRILESWLRDVYLGQTEKPWTLQPTPRPNYPPDATAIVREQVGQEVAAAYAQTGQMPDQFAVRGLLSALTDQMEERLCEVAQKTTARMERLIEDQMVEGGFPRAMGEFLCDLTVYPAAIMKAPVFRRRDRVSWVPVDGEVISPTISSEIVPEFERVDPFRIFPAPGAATPQDGYIIEHATFSYAELRDFIGTPGVNDDALMAALSEADEGRLTDWTGLIAEHERDDIDGVPATLRRKTFNIDVLIFHGSVSGYDLVEWGVEDPIEDESDTYEACVWIVGDWVIKAHLNYDPLNIRPYFKSCYEDIPGDFWGLGLPDVLDDVQGVVGAAARALVNNMSIASAPQVTVNVDRLPAGEDITQIYPWKIWQVSESQFGWKNSIAGAEEPN